MTVERPAAGDAPGASPAPVADDAGARPEWWRDPQLPWTGQPTRADLLCWAALSLSGLITLALLPLRPLLLATSPLRIGQPAVDVLDAISDYLLWISLALVVVVVVGSVRSARRARTAP